MNDIEKLVNTIFETSGSIIMSKIITIYGVKIKIEYAPLKGFIIACKFGNNIEMLWSDLVFNSVDNEIDRNINEFQQNKLLVNEYIIGTINIQQCKQKLIDTISNIMELVIIKNTKTIKK